VIVEAGKSYEKSFPEMLAKVAQAKSVASK